MQVMDTSSGRRKTHRPWRMANGERDSTVSFLGLSARQMAEQRLWGARDSVVPDDDEMGDRRPISFGPNHNFFQREYLQLIYGSFPLIPPGGQGHGNTGTGCPRAGVPGDLSGGWLLSATPGGIAGPPKSLVLTPVKAQPPPDPMPSDPWSREQLHPPQASSRSQVARSTRSRGCEFYFQPRAPGCVCLVST